MSSCEHEAHSVWGWSPGSSLVRARHATILIASATEYRCRYCNYRMMRAVTNFPVQALIWLPAVFFGALGALVLGAQLASFLLMWVMPLALFLCMVYYSYTWLAQRKREWGYFETPLSLAGVKAMVTGASRTMRLLLAGLALSVIMLLVASGISPWSGLDTALSELLRVVVGLFIVGIVVVLANRRKTTGAGR